MVENFRRPGVFVREVPTPPVPPVAAPSALGIVGFTKKGPADTAIRVDSFDDFITRFGGFTPLSLVPLTLEKFFNNGGQIAHVVRVTPVGSIKAENRFLGSLNYQNGLGFGNGTTTLFSFTIPAAPLAKAKLVATLQGDGTAGPYTLTIPEAIDIIHSLGVEAGAQFAIDEPTSLTAGGFIGPDVAASSIDYTTGAVSITFSATVAIGQDINFYITPVQVRSLDSTGVEIFAFDDGTGFLIGNVSTVGPNTVNYLTGEVDVNFATAPDGGTTIRLRNSALGSAGNVAIAGTYAGGFAGMAGGVDDVLPATGTVTGIAGAGIADGETLIIDDGVNPATTFEFDLGGGGVTAGNVPIVFAGGDSAAVVSDAIRTAINGAAGLDITAEAVFSYSQRDRWLFLAQAAGVSGDNTKVTIEGNENSRVRERSSDFTAPHLALGDGSAGPYTFVIPNFPLIPNSILITGAGLRAFDDGANTLLGDVTGNSTVNYETGEVTITFTSAIPTGAIIRASQHGFALFDVIISELQEDTEEFLVQEVFDAVEMVDSDSADFLTKVVNDSEGGSDFVEAILGEGGKLPTLERVVFVQTLGTGDGTTRRFNGTLDNPPVDPFSVTVFSGTPFQEAIDDGVGTLTGPDVDPFGVNTINYEDGIIDVTFKQPPDSAIPVIVIYAQLRSSDEIDLEGGSDGTGVITRSQIAVPGLEDQKRGVFALNPVEEALQVIVPDFAESALVTRDLIAYAEDKRNRFIIATTASGLTPTQAVNFRRNDIRSNSSFVAVYYPWLRSLDRSTGTTRTIPPIGHVAGVYSRVDRTRSEGKAPAGTVDGLLQDIVGLERLLEPGEIELVFPVGINTIIQASGIGIYLNGARTLSSDANFRYINIRRVFIAIRQRAEQQLRFALFEPIGPALFARIKAALTGIALEFFQKGALSGSNPREAFDVTVDEINTPELADAGIVKARLAIAPAKPAEFILVELSIKQRESTITVTVP